MTVKELKKAIQLLPDHMDILVNDSENERVLMSIESIDVKEIAYREEPNGVDMCKGTVIIINVEDQF